MRLFKAPDALATSVREHEQRAYGLGALGKQQHSAAFDFGLCQFVQFEKSWLAAQP